MPLRIDQSTVSTDQRLVQVAEDGRKTSQESKGGSEPAPGDSLTLSAAARAQRHDEAAQLGSIEQAEALVQQLVAGAGGSLHGLHTGIDARRVQALLAS
jgi:hypothetical protein